MSNDEVSSPTTNKRRSIFDEADVQKGDAASGIKEQEEAGGLQGQSDIDDLPDVKSDLSYPLKYVEEIQREIDNWKMHIGKTLEDRRKFKEEKAEREKPESENVGYDESILTPDQKAYLASFDSTVDEYMRGAEDFCNRVRIFARQNEPTTTAKELEDKYLAVQKKLEEDLTKKK